MSKEDTPNVLRFASIGVRAAGGLFAIVLSVAIAVWLHSTKPEPKSSGGAVRPIVVGAISVKPVAVSRIWDGYGTVRAMDAAEIAAEVSGRVVERRKEIEAGVTVRRGDVLARLDPSDYEQRVAAAREAAASWEAQIEGLDVQERRLEEQTGFVDEEVSLLAREYERAVEALEQNAGSTSEVEGKLAVLKRSQREAAGLYQQLEMIPIRRAEFRARLRGAQAQERLAQENLERATIRAPIDGIIQSIEIQEGQRLSVGTVVARIVDMSRVEIPLRLPVSAGVSIGIGDSVVLHTDSAEAMQWSGTVARVAPEADSTTRTLTVFVEVRQDPSRGHRLLRPGQFVIGRVESAGVEDWIIVPRRAVESDRVLIAVKRNGEETGIGGVYRAQS